MKFECRKCVESDPCVINWGDAPAPEYCPCDGEKIAWHKVAEPAALPKLTTEELARLGIEWPEWAVCAGVHAFGRLMFFEQRPRLNTSIGGWDYYGFDPIPKMSDTNDFFDYSDWQNSLIMRPAKVEKPYENRFVLDGVEYEAVEVKGEAGFDNSCRLCEAIKQCGAVPVACGTHIKRNDGKEVYWRKVKKVEKAPDWLKVGVWAAVGKFVGKIDWISRDGSECRITLGESRFAKTSEVKPVTWRAWTFEEAPEAVKCTVNGQTGIVYLNFLKDQYGNSWCGYQYLKSGDFIGFDQMLKEATQLSGLPCGVPQVDGVDLEIRPCD